MTEKTQFDQQTISKLQEIRRANAAIKACAEILNEHSANQASVPGGPQVFIRIEPSQEMGLTFAIEACARKIAEDMDAYFEGLGVNWLDGICPEVTAEAKAIDDLRNARITMEELEQRTDH